MGPFGALRALDRHWFAPTRRRDLGIVRIVLALFTLAGLLALPPRVFLGAITLGGQRLRLAAPVESFLPIPSLKVLMLPFGGWGIRPEPMFIRAVWWLAVIAAVLAVVGYSTRLALLALAATVTLLIAHFYSYHEFHHPEAILVMALWLLALGPRSGLTVDELRDRLRATGARGAFVPSHVEDEVSPFALWPLRTVQWLFVLIYLSAAWSKLSHGGIAWLNGYTLTYYFLQDGVINHIPLALWFSQHVLLAQALSAITLAFEMTFVLAVLVPSATIPYLLLGAAIHTGIYLTQHAPFFTFVAVYVVFLPQIRRGLASLQRRWRRPLAATSDPAPAWAVIYDGLCPLCIRTMTLIDYLDVGGRLRYLDFESDWSSAESAAPALHYEAVQRAIHVVQPNGRVSHGFAAFRSLARALPPFWPILPLLYFPGVRTVGDGIYAFIAARRPHMPCRPDACGVPLAPVPQDAEAVGFGR